MILAGVVRFIRGEFRILVWAATIQHLDRYIRRSDLKHGSLGLRYTVVLQNDEGVLTCSTRELKGWLTQGRRRGGKRIVNQRG